MNLKVTKIQLLVPEQPRKCRMFIFMDDILPKKEGLKLYRTQVIPQVMRYLWKNNRSVYAKIKNEEWRWSQKAGCSCGCSPGFIGNTDMKKDLYIDVKVKK